MRHMSTAVVESLAIADHIVLFHYLLHTLLGRGRDGVILLNMTMSEAHKGEDFEGACDGWEVPVG